MQFCGSVSSWICRILACMGGCLGCFTKPPFVVAVDEPNKGLKIQGQSVNRPSITDDFWSSSTHEMDNSAGQSQRSVSSISISNQTVDPHSSFGSNPPEFVNHGLLLWNQTRQQWTGNKGSHQHAKAREPSLKGCWKEREKRRRKLDPHRSTIYGWNATYESLLGTNKPFPRPIPLSEMVDFLVDVWEQEGLYD